jgi:hypothetical protein
VRAGSIKAVVCALSSASKSLFNFIMQQPSCLKPLLPSTYGLFLIVNHVMIYYQCSSEMIASSLLFLPYSISSLEQSGQFILDLKYHCLPDRGTAPASSTLLLQNASNATLKTLSSALLSRREVQTVDIKNYSTRCSISCIFYTSNFRFRFHYLVPICILFSMLH